VYDVASAAVVSRFVLPGTKGFEATFFPADDILLTGTVQQAQQCVFHSLRPPAPSFELTISTGSIAHSDVAWDGELGSPVVALATSSQLNVFTTDQKRLMHNDFGEEITTLGSKSTSAVRMQPGGKLVACVVGAHSVVVVSVEDGSELFRATIACTNLRWSPDGSWLALGTYQGVQILSANADFADVQRLEDGQIIPCLHFTSDGLQLAIGTLEGRITIWEVGTWTPTRTLELQQPVFMINFNNKGDQLA
jgi:WD40 repeat protein